MDERGLLGEKQNSADEASDANARFKRSGEAMSC